MFCLNRRGATAAERFRLLSKPYGIDALAAVLGETLGEARDEAADRALPPVS